ncbi:MAG: AAA family ATPase [Chitinophagaceae bacterium]
MQVKEKIRKGLVLGKFMPLHNGHIALVEFGLQHCDELVLLLCTNENETIPGTVRKEWLHQTFDANSRVRIELAEYNEKELPSTSVSSKQSAALWSDYIQNTFPGIDVFFSSEPYGEYVAEFLHIEHKIFDQQRLAVPVSASAILGDPFMHWGFIAPAARPWFVKKICISGSESTGKSLLAERLAHHYNTAFVPEMAREIIGKTEDVGFEELHEIAKRHAIVIKEKLKHANKLLFCDTDVNITKSYSQYLFNKELEVANWIEEANQFDLHIFLDTDCAFVQDGTRILPEERNNLSGYHRRQLDKAGINYVVVGGSWEERFVRAREIIDERFF